ncbi:hypothetical protein [Halomarina litorea]|uniref:hypothetical protein n=1 Tax=Halomarina litorea TaxID=2961595 RepID=UPI0020C3A236|nr:hypothetical protein [Halomarina sp. BCD28]
MTSLTLLPSLTPLDWGLVALVVIPLVQIPCVIYLSRYVDRDEGAVAPTPAPTYGLTPYPGLAGGAESTVRPRCADGEGRVACRFCSVCNDAAYAFCRACVGRLPM